MEIMLYSNFNKRKQDQGNINIKSFNVCCWQDQMENKILS